MHNEQARRRRRIVSRVQTMPIPPPSTTPAASTAPTVLPGRHAWKQLVGDMAADGIDTELVVEQGDSLVASDRHELYRFVHRAAAADRLTYRHLRRMRTNCWPCRTSWRGAGYGRRSGADVSHRWSPRPAGCRPAESVRPERRRRPAGSRAHFPQLVPWATPSIPGSPDRRKGYCYRLRPARPSAGTYARRHRASPGHHPGPARPEPGSEPTLKEVAEEFSMSRERVRQVADLTVPRFSRTFLPR